MQRGKKSKQKGKEDAKLRFWRQRSNEVSIIGIWEVGQERISWKEDAVNSRGRKGRRGSNKKGENEGSQEDEIWKQHE